MDCDDVMLALANRERTLTQNEGAAFHAHLGDCDACRALAVDTRTEWRWIARLPEDAFDGETTAMALPTVDPIVFDIDQEIASGGMGRITKATDRRLGREVAIKEVLDLSMRARFEREAMITARLQHPAIVPIYEAGTFPNGHPFYTMRLVWGGTLGNAIHKTTTMAQRLALLPHVIAVTDALAYAHSNRIIHRDLKPGNVLVGEFGETVVIDWGLAKELGDTNEASPMAALGFGDTARPSRPSGPNLTRVGSVLGTPGFMSPEQASGGAIDERADVYALGAILYNLLAGEPPYWDGHEQEGSTRLIAIGLSKPPTPIGERAPDAPADLRMIVERAMARRKEDRYPTAKEMAEELRRFAAGKLITREYTTRELLARWIRKHRTAVSVGGIATLALAIVVVVAFVSITRSRSAERTERQKAEAAELAAKDEAAKVKRTAAQLQADQGLRELVDSDGNRALAYLGAAYLDSRSEDKALHYLLTAASQDLDLREPNSYGSGKAVAFAGHRVVIFDGHKVNTYDGANHTPGRRLTAEVGTHARFDATGGSIAFQRTTQLGAARLEVWNVATATLRLEIEGLDGARLMFAPDGKRTATHAFKQLLVHQLAPVTKQLIAARTPTEIRDVAIDASHVATCGEDGVRVWNLARPAQAPIRMAADCSLVAFLEPGQLVIANKRLELLRWRVGAAAPDRTMSGHIPINVIAVSNEKQRIATGDATGVVMWSWNGDALGESRDITGGIDKLAFTPDGTAFVGAGNADKLFVWDTESFHLRQAFGGGYGSLEQLAIDPSGKRIASLAADRTHVWSVPKGRLVDRAPSTQFAIAGDSWLAITDKTLSIRSLVDPTIPERTVEHGLGAATLHASRDRVVLRAPGKIATFDPAGDLVIRPRTIIAPVIIGEDTRFMIDGNSTRLAVLESATGTVVRQFRLTEPAKHSVLSRAGSRLAVLFDTHLEQFDMATGDAGSVIPLPAGHAYRARFDPAGRRLLLYGARLPTLLVDGKTATPLDDKASSATGVSFSGDGTRFALGVGNTVQLWEVAQPASPLFTISSTIKDAYAVNADGTLLATGSIDGSIRIWDASNRQLDRLVGSQTSITRLAFARDDDRLLGQSQDDHTTVWDVHVDQHSEPDIRAALDRCAWKLDGAKLVLDPLAR